MDGRNRRTWPLARQFTNERNQMIRQMSAASVASQAATETCESANPIATQPALQCPLADGSGTGKLRDRNPIDEVRFQDSVTLDRDGRGERRMCHRKPAKWQGKKSEDFLTSIRRILFTLQNRSPFRKNTR